MKQRKIDRFSLTKEESEVCLILLNLRNRKSNFHLLRGFGFKWGSKRRRSAAGPNPAPPLCRLSPSKSSRRMNQVKSETKPGPEHESTSPKTPLSFSPSESDEKPEGSSREKTREDWMGVVENLVQERKSLIKEIETMRSRRDTLMASNLELEAKRQEYFDIRPNPHRTPHSGIRRSLNFAMESSVQGSFSQIVPRVMPDLNLRVEETFVMGATQQPADQLRALADLRARAAEARRRRMIKIRRKNNRR